MSQSGVCIDKIYHDACGSSDGLQVFDKGDKIDGYCFACSTYVPNPYGDEKPMQQPGNMLTIQQISELPSADLVDRALRKDTLDAFGVKVGLDRSTATRVVEHYYPVVKAGVIVGYKKRDVDAKHFTAIGDTKDGELFGQYQAIASGGRKLWITEGELDAMSVYQALVDSNAGTKYAQYKPAVVSLRKGAQGASKELAAAKDLIDKFQEIILCMDNDAAGQTALTAATLALPLEKVKVAKLPLKDANDMLKAGRNKELVNELQWNAKPYRPLTVVSISDIKDEAIKMPEMGMSWPWDTLTKWTYGRVLGNLYGVGAGVGMGKSTFFHKLIAHTIQCKQGRSGMLMLEEPPGKTAKLLATHMHHKRFNRPDGSFDQAELSKAIDDLNDHVWLCDHRHIMLGLKDGWAEIKQTIRHMAIVEGCQHIIIDPMSALVSQMDTSEANIFLNGAMADLAALAEQLQVAIYYGSHLNVPKFGKPHEEGGRVMESQFTGSRAMIKWSQYILGLEGNKQEENAMLKNVRWLRLLKDREYGNTGNFPLWYDSNSGDFIEVDPNSLPNSEASDEQVEKARF